MAYYELTFKLQYGCLYNDFSRPIGVFSHWSNGLAIRHEGRGLIENGYKDLRDRKSVLDSLSYL